MKPLLSPLILTLSLTNPTSHPHSSRTRSLPITAIQSICTADPPPFLTNGPCLATVIRHDAYSPTLCQSLDVSAVRAEMAGKIDITMQ